MSTDRLDARVDKDGAIEKIHSRRRITRIFEILCSTAVFRRRGRKPVDGEIVEPKSPLKLYILTLKYKDKTERIFFKGLLLFKNDQKRQMF